MQKNTGFTRVYKAAIYSWQGFQHAFRHEAAFRQELVLTLVMLPLAFYFDVTAVERVLMIMVIGLVLITELLNSAVEAVVDRIGSEYHELAGRAKDMGSAAVFVALALVPLVWGIILWP
ncbi:MAG: diacylglycerol kinase [Plesiomonas sp.]|uniref:diacylglycerol kinase n=1 Tax=Plesiomonas sp. TaxID=2486279 RepID=UPI003F2E98E1